MKKVALVMCNNMHMDIERANKLLSRISNSQGYVIESDYTKADIIIVMTCAFGNGKMKTMQIIADIEVNKPVNATIVLTGCFLKTNYELLTKVQNAIIMEFSEVMEMFSKNAEKKTFIPQNKLIISSGCQKRCAYCVYPNIDGKYVSKPKEQIFEELAEMYENETTIYITGELETSDYGVDIYGKDYTIANLVKDICLQYPKCNYVIGWFHPTGLTEEFISVLKECKNIVEIMVHIQHISDSVLKNMNRPSSSFTCSRIAKIKELCPHIAITTEVIVGFPGETEDDFISLAKYLDSGIFSDIGVASYEQVVNTKAAQLPQIPYKTRIDRMNFLLNRYQITTSYPAPAFCEDELEQLYYSAKQLVSRYKGVILNSEARQSYKWIAGTDTGLKLDIENTIFGVYKSILNARDELEISKLRAEVHTLYTLEFRKYIFKIMCESVKKQAILKRGKWILGIDDELEKTQRKNK